MILFGGFTIIEVLDKGYGVWSVFADYSDLGRFAVKVRCGGSELEATGIDPQDVAFVLDTLGSCYKPAPVLTIEQAAADVALHDAQGATL